MSTEPTKQTAITKDPVERCPNCGVLHSTIHLDNYSESKLCNKCFGVNIVEAMQGAK